jgi:recombination protein RecA
MKRIIDEQTLRQLYLDKRLTDLQIAEMFGCRKTTVYRSRKRFGIEAIPRWMRHDCNPTSRQVQVILGSLLGDGSISNGRKSKCVCQSAFEVQHCVKQKEYVAWKHIELADLCNSDIKETTDGKWRLRTFHHPYFSGLRETWYPNGVKTICRDILNEIGPLGLAVWYMDDGSLSKESNFIKLHTCAFTEEEHQVLVQWLDETFGVKATMKVYSGYRNLVIDLDSRMDFVKLLKSHVPNCMKYKVLFREYHTWAN